MIYMHIHSLSIIRLCRTLLRATASFKGVAMCCTWIACELVASGSISGIELTTELAVSELLDLPRELVVSESLEEYMRGIGLLRELGLLLELVVSESLDLSWEPLIPDPFEDLGDALWGRTGLVGEPPTELIHWPGASWISATEEIFAGWLFLTGDVPSEPLEELEELRIRRRRRGWSTGALLLIAWTFCLTTIWVCPAFCLLSDLLCITGDLERSTDLAAWQVRRPEGPTRRLLGLLRSLPEWCDALRSPSDSGTTRSTP